MNGPGPLTQKLPLGLLNQDLDRQHVAQFPLAPRVAVLEEMADTEARVIVAVAVPAVAEALAQFEAQRLVSSGLLDRCADHIQVVIEKLTKNVNEDHLREIFGAYGQIRDLDMPMNRQCKLLSIVLFLIS